MSGVNRTIWSPYPKLQFHQVFYMSNTGPVPLPFSDKIYSDIYYYLLAMDIRDPLFVIQSMWQSQPDSFTILDPSDIFNEDLCKKNIATWIQRNCSSENFIK